MRLRRVVFTLLFVSITQWTLNTAFAQNLVDCSGSIPDHFNAHSPLRTSLRPAPPPPRGSRKNVEPDYSTPLASLRPAPPPPRGSRKNVEPDYSTLPTSLRPAPPPPRGSSKATNPVFSQNLIQPQSRPQPQQWQQPPPPQPPSSSEASRPSLAAKRFNQLKEIFLTEVKYSEQLYFFFQFEIHGKTFFDELIEKKVLKKSELAVVTRALRSLYGIVNESRRLISKWKGDFDLETWDDNAGSYTQKQILLKMEEDILTHLDPKTLKEIYSDYYLNFKALNQILERVEKRSEAGQEIIAARAPELLRAVKESTYNKDLLCDPLYMTNIPIQRLMRYPLMLKEIVKDPENLEKRLPYEKFDQFVALYQDFAQVVAELNEKMRKPHFSIFNFWGASQARSTSSLTP